MPKKQKQSKKTASAKKTKKRSINEDEVIARVRTHQEQDDDELSKEEYAVQMKSGDVEEDVYTDEGREALEDDDEIQDWEAGFSKGAAPDRHH